MSQSEIVHDWNRVAFVSQGERQWTREEVVEFILEIEERVARGDSYVSESKPRVVKLSLVKRDG